jgi:FtsZ-binding cell division protein ZapB
MLLFSQTALFLSLFCLVAAFLFENGDETLQSAVTAIKELNTRLNELKVDNDNLKQRLQTAEGTISFRK